LPARARALGAGLDLEGHTLAGAQAVEVALGAAAVEEVLLAIVGCDEAEAAVADELLDGSVLHRMSPVFSNS
jgi:hypothetical protein